MKIIILEVVVYKVPDADAKELGDMQDAYHRISYPECDVILRQIQQYIHTHIASWEEVGPVVFDW